MDAYVSLFGMNDRNIALIEQECNVSIALRRNHLVITGDEKDRELAGQVITLLLEMIHRNENVDRIRIRYTIAMVREGKVSQIEENLKRVIAVTHRGKEITCKTVGQKIYVDTIRNHVLTFAVGPAGTGKTYLAMALAVMALKNKEVERIILTRPAVMPCTILWVLIPIINSLKGASLKWLRWPICADARCQMPLLSWMKHRTQLQNK